MTFVNRKGTRDNHRLLRLPFSSMIVDTVGKGSNYT